ncbi:myotubularin-related [Anaeramoeba ignava]|uniref:phosphatidylinositol-3,5-bisphosphate 3-phosphatase n=1 Tax=Anaeramoeba ignava TaxID=1746090 RepID=A0A9Q0LKJ1_ANAIG|nr:myotubularin-related [Anaeramoeba ignava]
MNPLNNSPNQNNQQNNSLNSNQISQIEEFKLLKKTYFPKKKSTKKKTKSKKRYEPTIYSRPDSIFETKLQGLLAEKDQVEQTKILNEENSLENEIDIGVEKNIVLLLIQANQQKYISGELHLTNYRLYFKPINSNIKDKSILKRIPNVPLGFLSKVQKMGGQKKSKGKFSYGIEIFCKDLRSYKFAFERRNHSRREMFQKIIGISFIPNLNFCFAFTHKGDKVVDFGWAIYDPFKEFKRQGIYENVSSLWTVSEFNKKYQICDSYPEILVLPTSVSFSQIKEVAKFRTKKRIPVLTWKCPQNSSVLCRSSQPRIGLSKKTNRQDESLLQTISEINTLGQKLKIFDCRPKANAVANRAKGGGFENSEGYSEFKIQFLGIDNIHVMRDSLNKLFHSSFYSFVDDKKWMTSIEDSNWLHHIQKILYWSIRVSKTILDNHSVLVHCSDGWDRTSQICACCQLMVDPYYRTLEGFIVLIEKDWLSFGHKFSQRMGHVGKKATDNQRSPIFVQWIDAVYQIWKQFPNFFEFNEALLIVILEHCFSLRFGTFLGNNDKERNQQFCVKESTYSLWTFVYHNHQMFYNPFYTPSKEPLYPNYSLRSLCFWERYYLKNFVKDDENSSNETILDITQTCRNLQKEVDELTNKIKKMKKQNSKTKKSIQNLQNQIKSKK